MWPRILMLLLVLLAPTSPLAASLCCDEGATTDSCCGPEGSCPISDEGECGLVAAGEAFKTSLPGPEFPRLEPIVPVVFAMAPVIADFDFPHAREPAHTPRYLLLQTLRN